MLVVEALTELGGVAAYSTLRRRASRHAIQQAVAAGDVVRVARGRYAVNGADEARRAAAMLSGVVSHRSAAAAWGWAQKQLPQVPEVTVPRHRRLERHPGIRIHRTDIPAEDIDDGVTGRERTIVDCLRSLEFDEALAIADSALRAGDFTEVSLQRLAGRVRGPGAARVRAVAERATGLAANPFESVLRALALSAGLSVRAQVPLYAEGFLGRPDLVDVERRIVLEADSFAWHGNRAELKRDARRYNAFVSHGWLVLRFSWEDVIHHPDEVLSVLARVAQGWTEGRCWACGGA